MLEELLRKSESFVTYSKRCYKQNGALNMTETLREYVDHEFKTLKHDTKKNYKNVYQSLYTFIHNPPLDAIPFEVVNDLSCVNNGIDYQFLKEMWTPLKNLDPSNEFVKCLSFK